MQFYSPVLHFLGYPFLPVSQTAPESESEAQPLSPPSKRWRQRPWWVRYLTYFGAFLALLIATYAFFDIRGRMRWKAYMEKIEASGSSLDIRKEIETPATEDSFWNDPFVQEYLDSEPIDDLESLLNADLEYDRMAIVSTPRRGAESWGNANFIALAGYYPNLSLNREEAAERMIHSISAIDETLGKLELAARKQVTAYPLENLSDEEILESSPRSQLFRLARILARRASCYLAVDDRERALNDILLSLKFGELLECDGLLIDAMFAMTVRASILQPIWEGMKSQAWNESELLRLENALGEVSDPEQVFESTMRMERAYTSVSIQHFFGSPSARFDSFELGYGALELIVQPTWLANHEIVDKTFRFLNRATFALTPTGVVRENLIHRDQLLEETLFNHSLSLEQRVKSEQKALREFSDQPIRQPSKILSYQVAYGPIYLKFLEGHQMTLITRTAIATERFHLANNRYPSDLADLVPEWISSIPSDIHSGGAIQYFLDSEGRPVLYSIGQNHRDDGGRPHRDKEQGDLVWRYSLPPGYTMDDYLK